MIDWHNYIFKRVRTLSINRGKATYLVQADCELLGLVVQTNEKVAQEDGSETVLVERVWDCLDADEAVFLRHVAVEVALRLDGDFGLVDEKG